MQLPFPADWNHFHLEKKETFIRKNSREHNKVNQYSPHKYELIYHSYQKVIQLIHKRCT